MVVVQVQMQYDLSKEDSMARSAGVTVIDSGHKSGRIPSPRKSARVGLNVQGMVRRAGHGKYTARIYDLSAEGCRIEFIERPRLDEHIWVKLDGLEALEATVCWIEYPAVGLEFQRPIHPAVFEFLIKRINAPS